MISSTWVVSLPIADVVTLDRVVCCYADYRLLLRDAARHARSGLALSYPRDRWFMRLGIWFENAFRRIRRNAFRTFVHPIGEIERVLSDDGFRLSARTETATWAADIYVRSLPARHPYRGS